MKVKIIFLCTLLIIALSCTMVSAKQNNPPSSLEEAKSMANNELGFEYFKQENINGKPIDWVIVNGLSNVDLGGQRYGALVYGESHGDNVNGSPRFLGYTKNDEDYTNPAHPHDAWGGGVIWKKGIG